MGESFLSKESGRVGQDRQVRNGLCCSSEDGGQVAKRGQREPDEIVDQN